jgi:CheY-like chemotaxis protein
VCALPPTEKRVLCVDGNADTCAILTTLLGAEGYETLAAGAREYLFNDGDINRLLEAVRRLTPDRET